jgi:hypothetical protein
MLCTERVSAGYVVVEGLRRGQLAWATMWSAPVCTTAKIWENFLASTHIRLICGKFPAILRIEADIPKFYAYPP